MSYWHKQWAQDERRRGEMKVADAARAVRARDPLAAKTHTNLAGVFGNVKLPRPANPQSVGPQTVIPPSKFDPRAWPKFWKPSPNPNGDAAIVAYVYALAPTGPLAGVRYDTTMFPIDCPPTLAWPTSRQFTLGGWSECSEAEAHARLAQGPPRP